MKHITSLTMMIMAGRLKVVRQLGFVLLLLVTLNLTAQIGDKGVLLTEVSGGFDAYQLRTSQNFIKSQGISTKIGINVGYNFHSRVGFGIEYENHNYLDDLPDSVSVDKIGATRIGVGTQFHAISTKHFALSFGMTVGLFAFNYNIATPNTASDIKATGVYQNIHVIGRFYFGEKARFGCFVKGGLINNPMTYKSFEYNGENLERLDGIPISGYRIASTGFHASIGLSYNWRIKKYY